MIDNNQFNDNDKEIDLLKPNEEINEVIKEEKKSAIKEYFSCFKLDSKSIATNAIIAAMYVALTYAFFLCSYGQLQIRVSEFLMILAFFNPNYIIGLTLGCLLSNIYSVTMGLTLLDMLFGTLATFISAFLMSLCKHLFLSTLIPAVINGIIVGAELTFILETDLSSKNVPILFWTNFGFVVLGEIIAISVIGYIFFMSTIKGTKGRFLKVINAKRNLNFKF